MRERGGSERTIRKIRIYLPIPLLKQDMTHGQFLGRV